MAPVTKNTKVEISKELYNIFKSLTFSRCVLGKSLVFRKVDDYIACGRFDEVSKNVYFYMTFDEFSFKFPGDNITFNDFSVFLDACKRQGFNSDATFNIRRVADRKDNDVVNISNSQTSMSYKLYNPNAYPNDMGFMEDVDASVLDPEMFSFNATSQAIQDITEICQSKHFECETFHFSKKPDCVVMCFNGPKDLDYKIKIDKSDIVGFDKIEIGEEIKFSFSCFQMMNQIGTDYKISLLNEGDNYNILCYSEIATGNQVIKSTLLSPSRISND